MKKLSTLIGFFVFCGFATRMIGAPEKDEMNTLAEQYVHLVLALGQHDPDYVDAFYGPAEWKTQAEKEKKSLDAIGIEAGRLFMNVMVDVTRARTSGSPSDAKKPGTDIDCCAPGTPDSVVLQLRRQY
jgi:hypothetical protein